MLCAKIFSFSLCEKIVKGEDAVGEQTDNNDKTNNCETLKRGK